MPFEESLNEQSQAASKRLGKLPAKSSLKQLHFASLIKPIAPTPPSVANFWVRQAPFVARTFSNDTVGCCTIASQAVAAMRMERLEQKRSVQFSTSEVLRVYYNMTARLYGGGDTGAYESDALGNWRKPDLTFRDAEGMPHTIDAFLKINHADVDEVKRAIAFSGVHGVKACFQLPLAWSRVDPPTTWDIPKNQPMVGRWLPGSWGGHCLAPGTRVLTADLRWVPIETLKVGDTLSGFDEFPTFHGSGNYRRRWYRASAVESTKVLQLPCYDLYFEDGTTVRASRDHMWLVGGKDAHHWVRTVDLAWGKKRSSKICKPFTVWDTDESRDAGYLAAAFDGEGWLDGEKSRAIHKAGFSQKDNVMLKHVRQCLAERGIATREGSDTGGFSGSGVVQNIIVNTSKVNLARFLGTIRPLRLLEKFTPDRFGILMSYQEARLIGKVACGIQPVIALQTSSRTFFAEGMASHNSLSAFDFDTVGPRLAHTWYDGGKEVYYGLQRITWRAFLSYVDECNLVVDSINSWQQQGLLTSNQAGAIKETVNSVSDQKIK